MKKRNLTVAIVLLSAAALRAQYGDSDPVHIRWSVAAGPTTARPSGRSTRIPVPSQCFSCDKTEEVVSGADKGAANISLVAAGVPGNLGIALRLEGVFNRTTSEPYVAPAPTCAKLRCDQPRKAEVDKAWMLAGGIEFSPLDGKVVAPYLLAGGGLALNRMRWRQDSSTTSDLTGKSIAFGPFYAVGGGVRATFRAWAAFMEWRQFTTFVTPGSQMTPLSIGIQYRPKSFGVGA